jgi:hypothetical protein
MTGNDLDVPTAQRIRTKREATLLAIAALKGITITPIETDNGKRAYIASRWSLTRQCDSLDQLTDWLERVTGTRP